MTIELIFYTQVTSIIGFVLAIFALYRLLVSQKDSVIEMLRQKIDLLEGKIKELESQSPDILAGALANRVEIAKSEIDRLQHDGEEYKGQIAEKESELNSLGNHLKRLNTLLAVTRTIMPTLSSTVITT